LGLSTATAYAARLHTTPPFATERCTHQTAGSTRQTFQTLNVARLAAYAAWRRNAIRVLTRYRIHHRHSRTPHRIVLASKRNGVPYTMAGYLSHWISCCVAPQRARTRDMRMRASPPCHRNLPPPTYPPLHLRLPPMARRAGRHCAGMVSARIRRRRAVVNSIWSRANINGRLVQNAFDQRSLHLIMTLPTLPTRSLATRHNACIKRSAFRALRCCAGARGQRLI